MPAIVAYAVITMSDEEKRSAEALVQSVLAQGDGAPTKPTPPTALDDENTEFSGHAEHAAAVELIDLYFTLEEPLERDACFDQIAALRAPVVGEFMRATMQGDDDEYVRAAAAAELTRRGDPEARAALEADLQDPENLDFYTNALQTLAEVDGDAFYPRLLKMWRDDELDSELALEVLAVMEQTAPQRAVEDFAEAITAIQSPEQFRDDQFESMTMAFVRNSHGPAFEVLSGLRTRAEAFTMDKDEHRELLEFIDEGLALLRQS
ncbi:MAG: HEAT repeat domain-containing protein [Myxococcota bacterium]